MEILQKINEAIYELEMLHCDRINLIIAYSPIVERLVEEEIFKSTFIINPNEKELRMFGVKVYNLHPYNEILIYDSKNSCYYPELIRKLTFSTIQKTEIRFNG